MCRLFFFVLRIRIPSVPSPPNPKESTSLVVVRPRFFAFIDTVLQSEDVLWSQATLVNLVGLRSLLAFSEFMGPDGEEAEAAKQKLFAIPQLETHTATGAGQRRMFSRKVGKNARAGSPGNMKRKWME